MKLTSLPERQIQTSWEGAAMAENVEGASQEHYLPYERTTAFIWTERAFDLMQQGKLHAEVKEGRPGVLTSHTWGECPRCGDHLDDWQPLSAVTGLLGNRGRESVRRTADIEPIEVDVSCGCGTVHPGAQADTPGCGVSFRIELVPVFDSNVAGRDS